MEQEVTQDGKMWALVSYGSFFLGLPLGVIPMLQRDDPYALHHGKIATSVWLVTMLVMVGSFVITFPLAFCTMGLSTIVTVPLTMLFLLWPLVVTVHGIVLTLNGDWSEPIGAMGLGDRFFSSIDVKDSLPEDSSSG
ncbi:MAG: hypothetical protein KTR31_23460 [Myxococcales bacterium]|nr:hypothetical protein [Myxococcales bacterium]